MPAECDVTRRSQVEDLVRQALSCNGRIDVPVNNAGFDHLMRMEDVTKELYAEILDINLRGTFLFTRELMPVMKT